jgi:DNA-binding NtrC family response regulator
MRDALTTATGVDDRRTDSDSEREPTRLILVLHARKPLTQPVRLSLAGVKEVRIGRGAERAWHRIGHSLDVTLDDHEVSRAHATLLATSDGWELVDLDSKNGSRVNGTRASRTLLGDGDIIELGAVMLMFRDDGPGRAECDDRDLGSASASTTPAALRSLSLDVNARVAPLHKIAPSVVPVLIRGETGTGKELTARAIHVLSGRRGPFVPLNCGAIPRELVESELFGAKRGAFSGAREDREGVVRRAHGGTLFLDEIAELPEQSQVALLRVLQDGEVRPIGAADVTKVDVRIVAATHQDLEARIATGKFREDLYARLVGFVVMLPPLRNRREDIGMLIGALLPSLAAEPQKVTLQAAAARALLSYPYPHNVRELEQALRAAVALSDGAEIQFDHLPEAIRTHRAAGSELRPEDAALRDRITELLREHGGNVTAVGRSLGKAPIQIRRWCRRLGVDLAAFRT